MVSLRGKRVYLDANVIIYAVEGMTAFGNLKAGLVEPLDREEVIAVTSELTLVETISGPRKLGRKEDEDAFRTFLTPWSHFLLEPISLPILERVIDLRVQHPWLKTPDAIHIATGIVCGCDLFITHDLDWARTGVNVVSPKDIG